MNEIKIEMTLVQLMNVTSAVRADATKIIKLIEKKTIIAALQMRFQTRSKQV